MPHSRASAQVCVCVLHSTPRHMIMSLRPLTSLSRGLFSGGRCAGVARDRGGCPFMEDECAVHTCIGPHGFPTLAFLGVYDGHGGHEASRYLQGCLHESVAAHLAVTDEEAPTGAVSATVTQPTPQGTQTRAQSVDGMPRDPDASKTHTYRRANHLTAVHSSL